MTLVGLPVFNGEGGPSELSVWVEKWRTLETDVVRTEMEVRTVVEKRGGKMDSLNVGMKPRVRLRMEFHPSGTPFERSSRVGFPEYRRHTQILNNSRRE